VFVAVEERIMQFFLTEVVARVAAIYLLIEVTD